MVMEANRVIVGLGHKSRVGKDTVGAHLAARHGTHVTSFAANLYRVTESMQSILGVQVKKDPSLLQKCGMMLREHYGDDVFVDRMFAELPTAGIIVITDVRFKNEFERIRREGGILINIIRPDRPIDRDPNHISEVDLDDAAWDFEIENTGTIEQLVNAVENVLPRDVVFYLEK